MVKYIRDLPPVPPEEVGNARGDRTHKWTKREFIAWDGEGTALVQELPTKVQMGKFLAYTYKIDAGPMQKEPFTEWNPEPQPYVLLANSKGDRIIDEQGLGTVACFELILNTKKKWPDTIFVGFGFNYDMNMILKDLPWDKLFDLFHNNWCRWNGYWIKWLPRKSLIISHGNKKKKTHRSAIIYDVFGFFQTSFLETCRKYLGDRPELTIIEEGKASRSAFDFSEMNDKIIPYNAMELKLLVEVMDILRNDLKKVNVRPSMWHGPGAIASEVLKKYSIPITRLIPKEVLDASQYAYAGGRFEQYWLGRHSNIVYEYDINSAYPAGTLTLPNLSEGIWENVEGFEPGSFGVWRIDYSSKNQRDNFRPEPLFCRSQIGNISYPRKVQGWYWTPEAEFCAVDVQEGWVFRPSTDERPFRFIEEFYDQRRVFQVEKNSAERALKLILNSIYGKLAQTIGWNKDKNLPPTWHQLEYAGYITSFTRAKIYEAILKNPYRIIAVETDAVFSGSPLDLPLSNKLGDWSETKYQEITYLQNGFYYAVREDGSMVYKCRGMDRERNTKQPLGLPYRTVLDHLREHSGFTDKPTPALTCNTTRFVGLGLALQTSATWRSWEKSFKTISLDPPNRESKRLHIGARCEPCQNGISMYDMLHPMEINGYSGASYARHIPWRQHPDHLTPEQLEWLEMDPEVKTYSDDIWRWQMQ